MKFADVISGKATYGDFCHYWRQFAPEGAALVGCIPQVHYGLAIDASRPMREARMRRGAHPFGPKAEVEV